MELMREVIDAALLTGCRPDVLARDLRNRLRLDSGRSLVKDCPLFADVRFDGLSDYLERHYPRLNGEERLLCCCIALGLPSDNLRLLLQHENNNSFYNRTGRIRRKLGLTNRRITVEEFLSQLAIQLENERAYADYFTLREK